MFLLEFLVSGPPVIFSITVALVLWIIVRKRTCARSILKPKGGKSDHSNLADTFNSCNSLDCVRCHKYKHLLPQVNAKLSDYVNSHKGNELEQLTAAILEKSNTILGPQERQCPNVLHLPYLEAKPMWNDDQFQSEVSLLEKSWKIIREECQSVIADDGWLANSTEHGCWATFYFYNQGQRNNKNCDLCPNTVALLDNLSNMMSKNVFGNVLFSILYPGTVVAPHFGPCNIRIRCHLGLVVPDKCLLTTDGKETMWQEGKCTLFDDSFLHSAVNKNSRQARVVFLLDLWHPQLTDQERSALSHVYSS